MKTLRLAAALPLLWTFACLEKRPEAEALQASATPVPREGGTLLRRLETDVTTLNFVLHTTEVERHVLSHLHDPLIALDAALQPIPATVERWDISPDGRTYTLHLDPRATYSDGQPVKASDVIFTLRKIIEVPSPRLSGSFDGLNFERTRAIDARTVQVVFDRPRASVLTALNIPVLAEHAYGVGDFVAEHNETVIGNGPYLVLRREKGSTIHLQRRADYWRRKPYLHEILFTVIPDESAAWNAMKRNELDEMRLGRTDFIELEGNHIDVRQRMKFHRFYPLAYNFFPWNTRDPLFRDKRVRQAMSMCLDRPFIVEQLYRGNARIMTGPFTPEQWAFNAAVPPMPFDPEHAAQILSSLGWVDSNGNGTLDQNGKEFEFEMLIPSASETSQDQALIFQQTLARIGVRLNVRLVDGATFARRLMAGQYQTASMAWYLDADPDPFGLFHSSEFPPEGQNIVFFSSREVDRLLMEGRRERDRHKRREIYQRVHEILADEQPYTWTVQVGTSWAINRRIQGVRESRGLGLFLWYPGPYDWWVASRPAALP